MKENKKNEDVIPMEKNINGIPMVIDFLLDDDNVRRVGKLVSEGWFTGLSVGDYNQMFQQEIQQRYGIQPMNQTSQSMELSLQKLDLLMMQEFLRKYNFSDEPWLTENLERNGPSIEQVATPFGDRIVTIDGIHSFEWENGTRIVEFSMENYFTAKIRFIWDKKEPWDFTGMLEQYRGWLMSESPLIGSNLDVRLRFILNIDDEYRLDDVILTEENRNIVVNRFLKSIELNEINVIRGIRASCGLLMMGPPGCGKTSVTRAIVNTARNLGTTAIFVRPDDIHEQSDIRRAYQIARELAPCIVVFEDIDNFGTSRRFRNNGVLPLLLDILDGNDSNNGVFTIASTNRIGDLDGALADRPGRFDYLMGIDLPDNKCRAELLDRNLIEFGFKHSLNCEKIAKKLDGFSGAWIKQIVNDLNLEIRCKDGKVRKDDSIGWIVVTEEDVMLAIERVSKDRMRVHSSVAAEYRVAEEGDENLERLYG